MSKEEILFEQCGRAGVVTLNKPETLNAVTDAMLAALNARLDLWEHDSRVEHIIIKASGRRAFSAGGDIRHLYERGRAGDYDFDFFAREYILNARIHHFPKPYIALVDGIAMGGGVGVSFHGAHRIAGDNIAFAMPEVGIGFFPDIGASYLLSRLPGRLGLYLALTGDRVGQSDAIYCGLATRGCASGEMEQLEDEICNGGQLDAVLEKYHARLQGQPHKPGPLEQAREQIDACFNFPTLGETVTALQKMAGEDTSQGNWAGAVLANLKRKSPTSLEIAFRQIQRGAQLSMKECMRMEYRILRRILTGHEFYEGIRAAIIDKDGAPQWNPAALDDVDIDHVEAHFADLGTHELPLP